MTMKHPFNPEHRADCTRCSNERARREREAEAYRAAHPEAPARGRKRPATPRNASRAEQHARYLDCGPGAWDDRD